MGTNESSFSRSIEKTFEEDKTEFLFHIVDLDEQFILNIHIGGALDSTFDIPLSSKHSISVDASLNELEDYDGIDPVLLVGDHSNLKIQIVAAEIGKLILRTRPKHTILSIGSRWFGKGDIADDNDFPKIMFILESLKGLLA